MKEIGIGILGFGTVGAGVVEGLQQNGDVIAERLGVRLVLRKIADLDLESDRGVVIDDGILTTDAVGVINDPAVDVVVELIGGTGVALDFVKMALSQGKAVVTANKKLLAEHGKELYALAEANGADLGYGASVGGGIPIIRALREGLSANQVDSIYGILNGTCNYILTEMETKGLAFDVALKTAQELGFAEADPGLDIDGFDTAHKAVILSSLSCGAPVSMADVHVEGVRGISKVDLDYALELGYRIKLLAIIKRGGDKMEARVHPTLVPLDNMLASVNGVFNAVMVNSDLADCGMYYGRGAGRLPTASTVLGDVCDIARNLASGSSHRIAAIPGSGKAVEFSSISEIVSCYYLRLTIKDAPGVLAQITDILAGHKISVESAMEKGAVADGKIAAVIVTHEAQETDIDVAMGEIEALDVVEGDVIKIRAL